MDGYCGIQNTAHRIEQSLRVPLVESRQPRAWVKTSLIQDLTVRCEPTLAYAMRSHFRQVRRKHSSPRLQLWLTRSISH